jgi:hypothetical protein
MKLLPSLLLIVVVGLTSSSYAQEPTVLQDSDYWNFYLQPELVLSTVGSDNAEYLGTEVGASLNERIDIGIGGYWLINDVTLGVPGVPDPHEGEIWYAGPVVRYHFFCCSLVDLSLQTMFAGGRVDVGNKTDGTNANTDFLLIEPSFHLGWNITDRFVMGAAFGYRFGDGSDSRLINDDDISGFSGGVFIRFDEF